MNLMNSPLLVLALSFLVLSLAVEIGDTLRKRVSSLKEEERDRFRSRAQRNSDATGTSYRL